MSDREKRIAQAAIQAAKEALSTLPDDAEYFAGTKRMTGRELKEKFETSDEFAAKTVERVVKLKFKKAR